MQTLWMLVFGVVIFNTCAAAGNLPEKHYQSKWCSEHNGRVEVILPDRTRADCITATHVIEFDFGKKWAEAIGQALYYGLQTGKKPGIVLITEKPSDAKYWFRLNSTIDRFSLPIETWRIEAIH